jgi:hypothetical protein
MDAMALDAHTAHQRQSAVRASQMMFLTMVEMKAAAASQRSFGFMAGGPVLPRHKHTEHAIDALVK